jgi:hypothetical protein
MEKILSNGEEYNGVQIESNVCPCCGSSDLSYGSMDIHEGSISYPWDCLDCDATGSEWYNLEFTGHNIEIEEIGKDMGEDTTYAIVDEYLSSILNNMQMDKPENFHDIVEFISKDIEETADFNFSYGDVVIGFRRFIEKGN